MLRTDRPSHGSRPPSHPSRLRSASRRGAWNERLGSIPKSAVEGARSSPESSETVRQTRPKGPEDTVRAAWRHAESGRNDLAPEQRSSGVTKLSVPIHHGRWKLERSRL